MNQYSFYSHRISCRLEMIHTSWSMLLKFIEACKLSQASTLYHNMLRLHVLDELVDIFAELHTDTTSYRL